MNVLERLKAGRARIADKDHWTQGTYARDEEGYSLDVYKVSKGYSFCGMGALVADRPVVSGYDQEFRFYDDAVGALQNAKDKLHPTPFGSIITLNDEVGYEAVMSCYDKAIQDLEGVTA